MRDRRDWVIAAMAAALLFGAGVLVGGNGDGESSGESSSADASSAWSSAWSSIWPSVLPTASAQGGGGQAAPAGPNGGVTIGQDPLAPLKNRVTTSGATASDSNGNNRMIAVTTPVGSGESVLFLIDTKMEQLTVYKFDRNKGLKFIAARKIDYDLRINGYEDMSEFSRADLKREYLKQLSRESAQAAKNK